jgi:hypothetical protein
MGRTIVLAAALLLAALLSWLQLDPPRVRPADAPLEAFSAARAMADVRVIARVPHPIGSPANRAVRDHLVRRLTALGLSPEVQATEAWYSQGGDEPFLAGGRVENVIGVLPGRNRQAPALLLMSHYDSVPGSPGAADDAAGVAAMLEIARALKTGPVPARDVVFLFTDGEEPGLLGARGFFAEHPLARRIGFTINLESRGGAGRALMFQTGSQNGQTVALFARSAVRPSADSLSQYIYERMPNDTDFTISLEADIPGLNYAFIGAPFDYHSPTSTPERLDQGSLQDLGAQVLSATREAALAESLPRAAPPVTFGVIAFDWVVAYPPLAGWMVLALCALFLLVAAARARRLEASASLLDVLQGAGASLYLVLLTAALLRVARRATGVSFDYVEMRALLAHGPAFEAAAVIIGLAAALYAAAALARGRSRLEAAVIPLTAGLACTLFGGFDLVGAAIGGVGAALGLVVFGRPAALPGAWAGVLSLAFLAACAVQAAAPTAAFVLAWPLTLAAAGAALVAMAGVKSFVDTIIVAVVAALGLAWIGPYIHLFFLAMDMPEALAAFAWIAALFIWPLAHPRIGGGGRLTALSLLVVGLALVGWVRFDEPWGPRYPRPVNVAYMVDVTAQRAWRVAMLGEETPYVRRILTADGGAPQRRPLPPIWSEPVTFAPARAVPVAAPAATLAEGLEGARLLTLLPPAGARSLSLELKANVALTDIALDGGPTGLALKPGQALRLRWTGDPDGLVVSFRPAGPGALELAAWSAADAWPAGAAPLPQPPRNVMPYGASPTTFVAARTRVAW